ncbi:MAG: hypothetical protein DWQ10_04545 [Calditrichaeota bacterium]|nr:MAG: hypothetical protein DWQ10_04545 [Calditrichota bacterium]
MNRYLLAILIIVSSLTVQSCENRKFTQSITFAVDEDYMIQISGANTFDMFFTRQDIIAQLNFPEQMRVTKVSIESISGTLSSNPSNQAAFFHSSGQIDKPNGKVQAWDSEGGFIPIPFPVIEPTFNIANSAIQEGIEELANQIFDALSDENDTSTLALEITVKPEAGKLLAINANFKIVASVEYEYCQEVPPFFSEDGEECDL